MNKLVLNTLVAGCLTMGVSFAAASADSTAFADKAKLEAFKEEMNKKRDEAKATHDSLKVEHKEAIEKFKESAKIERNKWRASRDSIQGEIKNLVEDCKNKVDGAKSEDEKDIVRKDLNEAVKALHHKLKADQKKDLDAEKQKCAANIDANRAEWEKLLAVHKASHDSIMVKMDEWKSIPRPSYDSTATH